MHGNKDDFLKKFLFAFKFSSKIDFLEWMSQRAILAQFIRRRITVFNKAYR